MKKLNISINLLQLQGAVRATIKGEDCVVIRLAKSRAKPHQNGKVYLRMEAGERKEPDKLGKTHYVVEPLTKEEREGGMAKLYIGDGEVWSYEGQAGHQSAPPQRTTRNIPRAQPQEDTGDEIPF